MERVKNAVHTLVPAIPDDPKTGKIALDYEGYLGPVQALLHPATEVGRLYGIYSGQAEQANIAEYNKRNVQNLQALKEADHRLLSRQRSLYNPVFSKDLPKSLQ